MESRRHECNFIEDGVGLKPKIMASFIVSLDAFFEYLYDFCPIYPIIFCVPEVVLPTLDVSEDGKIPISIESEISQLLKVFLGVLWRYNELLESIFNDFHKFGKYVHIY